MYRHGKGVAESVGWPTKHAPHYLPYLACRDSLGPDFTPSSALILPFLNSSKPPKNCQACSSNFLELNHMLHQQICSIAIFDRRKSLVWWTMKILGRRPCPGGFRSSYIGPFATDVVGHHPTGAGVPRRCDFLPIRGGASGEYANFGVTGSEAARATTRSPGTGGGRGTPTAIAWSPKCSAGWAKVSGPTARRLGREPPGPRHPVLQHINRRSGLP